MEVPDAALLMSGVYVNPKEASKFFLHNQTSGSTLKNKAYGVKFFLGSRSPQINFC